jgi:hypothetical protein
MFVIDSGRITDPNAISVRELVDLASQRGQIVVQFSRPDAYSASVLASLNEACRIAKDLIEVRFYGHYGTRFNAVTLQHLPEVRNLAVDCLSEIANEDEIGRIPNLTRLSFGVFEFDKPEFLATLDLGRLTHVSLSETRKRNFDLSPLSQATLLEELFIHGHAKGIDVVANLPVLRMLTLSAFAKTNRLDFIKSITNLSRLTLILGGREHIDDLSSESLEMLQILRVRGLSKLGDLSRMPALSALRIEDQLQLAELNLTGTQLQRLWLFNCKNLSVLSALDQQGRLKEFFVSQTKLDLEDLRDRQWPPAARSIQLFSGSRKWNEDAKARLTARGLGEKNEYWP